MTTSDPRLTPVAYDHAYLDDAIRAASVAAVAVTQGLPDAAASDPVAHGWMRGFPPPPDRRVVLDPTDNRFPRSRWAFSHVREMRPTATVWRGSGPVAELPRGPAALDAELDALPFTAATGEACTLGASHALTYVDGIAILHRGRIVHERYFGALDDHTPHLAMSVTKSFIGTLVTWLAEEKAIDPARSAPFYVPELAGGGFADASVRQVLHMTTGVAYDEDYTRPESGFRAYGLAANLARPQPGETPGDICGYLTTIGKLEPHDARFTYRTVNTEVLAWILRRVTGLPVAKLLSERIWQKLGAEADAYFIVDALGTESCGGGLSTTLRDLARFGEMMRCEGAFNGRQILPAAVVQAIREGGDRRQFLDGDGPHYPLLRGGSYSHQWWHGHDAHGVFEGRGIHGQRLHVDPRAEMTIARYASHPFAASSGNDPYAMPAFRAVALRLMAG
ncbi:MAG: serine hydrolase [Burkholderiaceae bacterium]